MAASFPKILNSRLFKFTVGEDIDGTSSEFSVHEEAIAQLSAPLRTLTQGSSPEARAGRATWKEVSKETFERFAQFAYTGDYSIPKTEKRNSVLTPPSSPHTTNGNRRRHGSDVSASTVEPHEKAPSLLDNERRETVLEKLEDDTGTILNQPTLSKNAKRNKRKKSQIKAIPEPQVLADPEPEHAEAPPPAPEPEPDQDKAESEAVEAEPVEPEPTPAEPEAEATTSQEKNTEEPPSAVDFPSLSYSLLADRDNYHGTCEPSTDFEKEQSYSKVLLSHASLYVLGDFQLIHSLKALALFKLHKTLCSFKLDNENIGDITDLTRYAYGKGADQGIEGLRGLVCQYMAIHAVELSGDTRFMDLLAEGGQIVKDFFNCTLQSNRKKT